MSKTEETVTAIIGTNAGKVWNVLKEKGPLTIDSIVRNTKLKSRDTDLAIGWLAREDKLVIDRDGRGRIAKVALR